MPSEKMFIGTTLAISIVEFAGQNSEQLFKVDIIDENMRHLLPPVNEFASYKQAADAVTQLIRQHLQTVAGFSDTI